MHIMDAAHQGLLLYVNRKSSTMRCKRKERDRNQHQYNDPDGAVVQGLLSS